MCVVGAGGGIQGWDVGGGERGRWRGGEAVRVLDEKVGFRKMFYRSILVEENVFLLRGNLRVWLLIFF